MLLAFAVAMIMSVAAIRPAAAATIDYSTVGTFTSSGTATSTSGSDSVTFAALSSFNNESDGGTPVGIGFGTLTLSGSATETFSDTLTLTVAQTSPTSGSGFVTANLSGKLIAAGGGKFSGVVLLTFNSTTITIGSVTYTLPSQVIIPNPGSQGGQIQLSGTAVAAAVPVPAAAWGGMGLLGLIVASKVRRTSLFA